MQKLYHSETPKVSKEGKAGKDIKKCLVLEKTFPKAKMIRFVISPSRTLVPDLKGTLDGRGFWVCACTDALAKIGTVKTFINRKGKGAIDLSATTPQHIGELLTARLHELLGLATKAGLLEKGFDKASQVLKEGRCGLIILACDASPRSTESLELSLYPTVKVASFLDFSEISAIIDKEKCGCLAIRQGKLAESLAETLEKLHGISVAPSAALPASITRKEQLENNHE